MTDPAPPIDYICAGCAGLYGAESPPGHVCTAALDKCQNCGEVATLISVDDWNWPNGKPTKWRGAVRD